MRAALNVVWLVLAGWWLALVWLLVSLGLVLTIVGIPFAAQTAKIAGFVLWPFGRALVTRADANLALSGIGNIAWIILAGWWLAIVHVGAGIALVVSIVGIPLGLGAFKMVPVTFAPFGREIVESGPGETAPGGVWMPTRWHLPTA